VTVALSQQVSGPGTAAPGSDVPAGPWVMATDRC